MDNNVSSVVMNIINQKFRSSLSKITCEKSVLYVDCIAKTKVIASASKSEFVVHAYADPHNCVNP